MTIESWNWLPWAFMAAIIFFGLGWLAARIDIRQLLSESRSLPQAYFKGLNFLLNEQPDKAIEAFIDLTKTNPEAVDLQFALGSLFRRRGEVDRAIRVHQNLCERSDIGAEQRASALLELAQDYQKAGLLDHADRILNDLTKQKNNNPTQQEQALRLLVSIYVQEKDWQKAIDTLQHIKRKTGSGADAQEAAQYYCEWAAESYLHGHKDMAEKSLHAALETNPQCVRAHLMEGEWLAAAGNHREAIEAWQKIESQDPAYLGLMAERLLASYRQIGEEAQGLQRLKNLQEKYPALDLLNALFQAVLETEGAEAAYQLVKKDLHTNPTLVGLDRLLEAQILAAPADRKPDLEMLKALVHSHSSQLAVYLCKQCGFKAKQFYWHCPACGGWETFPPRRTAEYETSGRHLARLQAESQHAG